jgi:hypothetical protein
MTLEKRGNSEIEIKCKAPGEYVIIFPGTNEEVPYDGRFNSAVGLEKLAALQVGQSIYYEV